MHPEAPYWTLLTAPTADPALTALRTDWLGAGNRSLRDLFEMHPDVLAAAMGRSVEDLGPLLRLRELRPLAERLLDRLARAGVDMLAPWDRAYPRTLRDGAPGGLPTPFWYLGPPALLAGKMIAVIGARESGGDAVDFARAAGSAVAAGGKTVLAGVARAVERNALEGAAAGDGKAVGLLAQGIARALPDLQRLQPLIRAGALLVISPVHPEAAWHPGQEERVNEVLVLLAGRLVVAQAGESDSTMRSASRALAAGTPTLVRNAGTDGNRSLLERGGVPVDWPSANPAALEAALLAQPPALAQLLREPAPVQSLREAALPHSVGIPVDGQSDAPRPMVQAGLSGYQEGATTGGAPIARATARPDTQGNARPCDGDAARSGRSHPKSDTQRVERPSATTGRRDRPGSASAVTRAPRRPRPDLDATPVHPEQALESALLHCLQRRKRPTPKGVLLQALGVPEGGLDRALAALIAAGRVQEHVQRAGVAYALPAADAAFAEARFQLSLFGQEMTGSEQSTPSAAADHGSPDP